MTHADKARARIQEWRERNPGRTAVPCAQAAGGMSYPKSVYSHNWLPSWFDASWSTPEDTHGRDRRVFKIVPYPAEVEPLKVEEWHMQRADCFVGHLIDDYGLPDGAAGDLSRRVAYALAEAAAMERSRKDGWVGP